MKKIIILLFWVASFMSGLIPGAVYAAENDILDVIGLLDAVSIIAKEEMREEKLASPITRMEFAQITARMLGIDESAASDVNYFYDVPEDHWGKAAINALAERNMFIGASGYFRPDEIITREEAAKTMVCAIGRTAEAEMAGGYPQGYMGIAGDEKLFAGVSANRELTYRDAAVLLYNTLHTEIFQLAEVGEGARYQKQGETILTLYHDVYYDEAQLTAVFGISINENTVSFEDELMIGENRYRTETGWLYDFLGMNIKFYYRDDEDDKVVIYVSEPGKTNESISIDSDQYIEFREGYVCYYKDSEQRKSSRVKIAPGAAVLRNGKNVSDDMQKAFAGFYGYMRMIKTKSSGGADVVIIEDYRNVAVSHIDTVKMTVYDKYDPSYELNLSNEEGGLIKYFSSDNEESGFESITKDEIISVAASERNDFILVRINDEFVEGNIIAQKNDGNDTPHIVIAGEEYAVEPLFYKKNILAFSAGTYGTFKFDILGKIAHCIVENGNAMKFAYLINGAIVSNINEVELDTDRVMLKLFTEDGEMLKLACANKVKIDSKTYRTNDEILQALSKEGEVVSQLIRFTYDSQGFVKQLDTQREDPSEGNSSLRKINTEKNIYHHWSGLIGQNAFLSQEVKVMVLPPEGTEKIADTNSFMIKNKAAIPSGRSSRIDMFRVSPDSLELDFVVYYKPQNSDITQYAPLYVVEKKEIKLNADDMPVTCLTLNDLGSGAEYLVAPDYQGGGNDGYTNVNPDKLSKGDIIRITQDYKNEIINIQRVFDYSRAKENGNSRFFVDAINPAFKIQSGVVPGNFFDGFKLSYGYVTRVSGNNMLWGYEKPGDGDEMYNVTIESSKAKIVLYDESQDDVCKEGTIADIIGYVESSSNFSRIVTLARSGVISQIIVYK